MKGPHSRPLLSLPRHVSPWPSVLLLGLATALVVWACPRTAHAQSGPSYSVTDLGSLGGPSSVALTLDELALPEVYGYSTTATGDVHAFRARPGYATFDLGTLGGRRSEARKSHLYTVVGLSERADGQTHAAMFDYGRVNDLGTLGGQLSYANGVTRQQQSLVIVGGSTLPGEGSTHAFIYRDNSMVDLGATLGGANSVANDINTAGHVVGTAELRGASVHRAFMWMGGVTSDLGSLGESSEATAINELDIVVGRFDLAGGIQHAFRYVGGVMHDLGTLGGGSSHAADVNGSGAIVGWAETPQGARHAFVWRDGVMSDVNDLIPPGSGWILESATAIADLGAIVGVGQFNGDTRAFMLTPPADLSVNLSAFDTFYDTNYPKPVEAGQSITFGATVFNPGPYTAIGSTIIHTFSGPVEIDASRTWGAEWCAAEGLQLTCRMPPIDVARQYRGMVVFVRTTGPGGITHAVTLAEDVPDPDPSNNTTPVETNLAISLAGFTLTPPTVVGGRESPLGHVDLTSRVGEGVVTLTSSNPQVASVPSQFAVLGGTWREFYVTTQPVSVTTAVQISATYGLITRVVTLTIAPAGTAIPYSGVPAPIPGVLQAEEFDVGGEGVSYHDTDRGNEGGAFRQTDVDLENTSDADGGANVGWLSPGEWLDFTVAVASSGTYSVDSRVASPGGGGTYHIEVDGVDKTGPIVMPDTGAWQSWTTVSRPIVLTAGTHALRVSFDSNGATGVIGNLNHLRFTRRDTGPAPTPFGGTPWPIPGTIQAEDYDDGGESVAYADVTLGNNGGGYRSTDVDIEAASDAGGGFNVGWITPGEWLGYTVNVSSPGTYRIDARVASFGAGGTFHLTAGTGTVAGVFAIPDTGGWQTWTTVSATVALPAGPTVIRMMFDQAGPGGDVGNVNWLRFTAVDTPTPFSGTPQAIPGRIEAEYFDRGGEGVAYHDTTPGDSGGWRPDDAVDVQPAFDASDVTVAANVGWMTAGEWLTYTVTVAHSGPYTLRARVAAPSAGGAYHVESNGVPVTGMVWIPDTGAWQAWTNLDVTVSLTAGTQVMRFVADANGPAGVFGNLNYLELIEQ